MNCRFVICIPVYNNPNTIVDVIDECLAKTAHPVMVVDDGSNTPVENLYLQKHAVVSSRLSFVRHSVNQGKGVALQTAFTTAIDRAYTHVIAIDGDGQHSPADIEKLVQCAEMNPWSLVVGDRDMQTENVPGSSTFGKAFSNFWIKYQTSVQVADSQSGFRVYPLFFLQTMKFYCKKYDFEIEVLTRLIWKGVTIKNVKVSVKYFPPEKRVSHFNKLRDNARISVINTFLVIGAMLQEQTSPVKSALAVALGVFVGCTPIYGLHTLVVALFSLVFRLNFVYLWIGSNISIPPMVPLLIWGSSYLGGLVLGEPPKGAIGFSTAWIVGSGVLGLTLGVISFVSVLLIKKSMNKKKTVKKAWTGKNRNPVGIFMVKMILHGLGIRAAYFIIYFVAAYYCLASRRTHKSFSEYWKVVKPEATFWQRQVLIYRQVLVFAKTLIDRALQREANDLRFEYHLDESVADFVKVLDVTPKGTVMMASHVGGWELIMTFFARLKTNKEMLAVMHGIQGQFVHSSLDGGRKAEVIHSNLQDNSIMKMRSYLNSGQTVGLMGDRPVTQSCELVPFFGKLAVFDTTPIRTALACNAEVAYVFAFKESLFKYNIYTFRAHQVFAETATKEEKVRILLNQYVQQLEKMMRQYPEQWFNFFPFFSEATEAR